MQAISREKLDENGWNQCVKDSPNGLIYSLTWYLDIVCPHWIPCINETGGKIRSCMPLPVQSITGIKIVRHPLFAQQLGVSSLSVSLTQSEANAMNNLLQNYSFIAYQVNYLHQPGEGLEWHMRHNYILFLNAPYDELKAGYSTNRKRNLSKTKEFNFSVDTNGSENELIDLFQKSEAGKNAALKSKSIDALDQLMRRAKEEKCGFQMIIKDSNLLPHAGAFFLVFKNRITFLFGAASHLGRSSNAMSYLFDHVIEKFAGTGRVLDFEGSNDINLARFYQTFGGIDQPYWLVKKNQLYFPMNLFIR